MANQGDRKVQIIGGIAVAVVVVGIVAAGWFGAQSAKPQADANAPLPKGVLSDTYGLPYQQVDAAKSTLTIWEDPQCPYCGLFEATVGSEITQLAEDGTINVVYQMAAFLDEGLPQSKQSSRRAINALGCAVDQGAGNDFHQVLFAGQPETEGEGWSDAALLTFGQVAGLKDAAFDAFETCVNDGTYLRWADNGTQAFRDNNIPGTPYVTLDGTQIPDEVMGGDAGDIVAWIKENAK